MKTEKYKKKEPFTVYLCNFYVFCKACSFLPDFHTCFVHFKTSQKMKALQQKKCYQNSEPQILVLYPLIHPILPNILKLSNFQVSYHFGKLLSSWFQNFCPFCNILTEGHFTDHWTKRLHFFLLTLYMNWFLSLYR